MNDITVISIERGLRFGALVDVLRKLRYSVEVAPPAAPRPMKNGGHRIAYLGPRPWPEPEIETAVSSDLLALDDRAFEWTGSVAERAGDFMTWPCSTRELLLRLKRNGFCRSAGREAGMRARVCEQAAEFALIGRSATFVDALVRLKQFAESDAAILIQGETGTGKGRAARAVHGFSRRAGGPFEVVNCGALTDTLIESEFFGHDRGAFTDAKTGRAGFVEQAAGGTLFLDEVEALSPKGQVALLRFLESFEYRRVGSAHTRRSDLRIISASNESLEAMVRRSAFRRDLFYRLNVLAVTLPPLRERPGDVELLAAHFLERIAARYGAEPAALAPASRRWLASQDWPGNVRELENLLHRAVVTASDGVLDFGPEARGGEGESLPSFNAAKQAAIARFEQGYLTALLEETAGNVTRAAELAGKERRCLGKLLSKHNISSNAFRPRS